MRAADVAEDHEHGEPAVDLHGGRGNLGRQALAVEPAKGELGQIVLCPGGDEPGHPGPRQLLAGLVHDLIGAKADQLVGAGGTEECYGLAVGEDNPAGLVDVDRVGRGLDQGAVALLALAQGRLGPLALVDVDADPDPLADGAVLVAHRDATRIVPPPPSVPDPEPVLDVIGAAAGDCRLPGGTGGRPVLRMQGLEPAQAPALAHALAGEGPPVGVVLDHAPGVGAPHHGRERLDQCPIPGFAGDQLGRALGHPRLQLGMGAGQLAAGAAVPVDLVRKADIDGLELPRAAQGQRLGHDRDEEGCGRQRDQGAGAFEKALDPVVRPPHGPDGHEMGQAAGGDEGREHHEQPGERQLAPAPGQDQECDRDREIGDGDQRVRDHVQPQDLGEPEEAVAMGCEIGGEKPLEEAHDRPISDVMMGCMGSLRSPRVIGGRSRLNV